MLRTIPNFTVTLRITRACFGGNVHVRSRCTFLKYFFFLTKNKHLLTFYAEFDIMGQFFSPNTTASNERFMISETQQVHLVYE